MEKFNARGLTRDDERETIRFLAERRQLDSPEHVDPAWLVAARRKLTQ